MKIKVSRCPNLDGSTRKKEKKKIFFHSTLHNNLGNDNGVQVACFCRIANFVCTHTLSSCRGLLLPPCKMTFT